MLYEYSHGAIQFLTTRLTKLKSKELILNQCEVNILSQLIHPNPIYHFVCQLSLESCPTFTTCASFHILIPLNVSLMC